jgi:ParB family transcriptional regulator, chromosome partitioning protein
MESAVSVRRMSEREYLMVPVDQIRVVNPRDRDKNQFQENVRSIDTLGLYKPILVNKRNVAATGYYDLICGQGRLIAHKHLGKTHIAADVLDVDERVAQIMTLGENIARTPPQTIEYARSLKDMRDHGMSIKEISVITGKAQEYVTNYIRLIDQGEERLIKGVEERVFSLNFAMAVAQSEDRSIQHLLMDAFDNGLVSVKSLPRVRKIIEDRLSRGKSLNSSKPAAPYTVGALKRDIGRITHEKESFVREVGVRENRLTRLLVTLQQLKKDEVFVTHLQDAGLINPPQLKGNYGL